MGETDLIIEPAAKTERKVPAQPAWARVYDQMSGFYNGGQGGELYDGICRATEEKIIANTGKQIGTFGYVVHEDDMRIGTVYAVNDNSRRQWDGQNFPSGEATEIDLSDQGKIDILLALAQGANELDWRYKSDGKTETAKICSYLRSQVELILFKYAVTYKDTALLQTVQNLGRRPGGEIETPRQVVSVPAETTVPVKVVADIDIEKRKLNVEQMPVELPPPPLAEETGGSGDNLGEVNAIEKNDVKEPVEKRKKKLVRPASRPQRWKHVTVDRLSPKILPEITTTEW